MAQIYAPANCGTILEEAFSTLSESGSRNLRVHWEQVMRYGSVCGKCNAKVSIVKIWDRGIWNYAVTGQFDHIHVDGQLDRDAGLRANLNQWYAMRRMSDDDLKAKYQLLCERCHDEKTLADVQPQFIIKRDRIIKGLVPDQMETE